MPARLSSATASSRARGCGVCGSLARHAFSSRVGHREVRAALGAPRRSRCSRSRSRSSSGDFVSTEHGLAAVAQRLPDPAHQLVAALDPLVRVGVRPQRDVLALPRRPRQLGAQHLGHVDLDDDLLLEVAAGVEVEVLVGGAGEAVVADDAVGDEVAGAGRDVVQAHRAAERLDATHTRASRRVLSAVPSTVALARDRRVGEVEEAQPLAQPAADADAREPVGRRALLDDASKPKCPRQSAVQSRIAGRCWRSAAPARRTSPRRRRSRPGTPCASRRSATAGHAIELADPLDAARAPASGSRRAPRCVGGRRVRTRTRPWRRPRGEDSAAPGRAPRRRLSASRKR